MSKIKIISKSYYLCDSENKLWFAENIGEEYSVKDEDIAVYCEDKKFAKNELMASHLLYTVSKTIELSGEQDNILGEVSGISFGTRYGCMSDVEETEKNIRAKGERGITPKIFSNTVPCGTASKVALKQGFKAFNVTNYNGNTGGLDALMFACDMLDEKRCRYSFPSCGDDECGVYASMMLRYSDENDGLVSVSGYENGMVYGDSSVEQMEFIIKKVLDNSGIAYNDCRNVFFIAETDEDKQNVKSACRNIFKDADMNMVYFSVDKKIYSAKGMLAVMYAEKCIKEKNLSNALVIQIGHNKYFSCFTIEK